MNRTASGLAALAMWQMIWFLVTVDGQGLPRMNTTVAREHVGETAIVCGQVIGYGCSESGGVMQLATNDQGTSFDLRIPLANRRRFGPYPEEQHLQKFVCATGRIESTGAAYEVVLNDPSAITVLPDRQGLPPFAAGVHRPRCDTGVTLPKVKRVVNPSYTLRAMRERVAGRVFLQVVAQTDGTVGEARVIRGLHRDLDAEAIKAARGWQFEPATLNGEPVPVVVTIEMTFTLRDRR